MIIIANVVPSGPLSQNKYKPTQFKNAVVGFFIDNALAAPLQSVTKCNEMFPICGGYVVGVGFALRLFHGNG